MFGEVPDLASRLQGAAEAGQVIVSAATASLADGFYELEPLPPLTLEGLRRPVRAYRVLAPSGARTRLQARMLVGFVACDDELAWLEGHWTAARGGPARCVVVTGEPGIGKSRLLSSLRSVPAANALQVLVLASLRVAAGLAFWLSGDARMAWVLAEDALQFAYQRADMPALPGPMLHPCFQLLQSDRSGMPAADAIAILDQALAEIREPQASGSARPRSSGNGPAPGTVRATLKRRPAILQRHGKRAAHLLARPALCRPASAPRAFTGRPPAA